jgi:hypothetical protein
MFGNGDVPVFGGSLNFFASLPDGRRFGVVILPDERESEPAPATAFTQYRNQPITAAIVRSYFPSYAEISWRPAPPTFFGRTEVRGSNGRFRVGLLAGGEGPNAATCDEMRTWFVTNVFA